MTNLKSINDDIDNSTKSLKEEYRRITSACEVETSIAPPYVEMNITGKLARGYNPELVKHACDDSGYKK